MNNSIRLDDLIDKCTDFVLIHGPDLVEPILVTLLESLELVLEFLKLLGELLVVISQLDVLFLEIFALFVKLLFDSSEYVLIPPLLSLKPINSITIDLLPLLEYLMIELQLLLIESVHGLHVLHALLKDLHFLLKLDLLLSLVISVF